MTPERQLKKIVACKEKKDKIYWARLQEKMDILISQIDLLESKKIPILEEVQTLRAEMLKLCIHPKKMLVVKETHILCKFCERKISLRGTEYGTKEKT